MRPLLALAALALLASGCVTVVVAPGSVPDCDAGAVDRDWANRALRGAAREAERREHRAVRENLDALVVTAAQIAADVQAWALKPRAFGGGDGHLAGVRLDRLGYNANHAGEYVTVDGAFRLEDEGEVVRVIGENQRFRNRVILSVAGTSASDLSMSVGHP